MNGESLDILQDNIEKLKQLFPDIFTETKGDGQELRGSEKMKIKCGTEHFKKFEDIVF